MSSNKFYEGYEKLKTVGQGAFGTATLYRRVNDGKQVVMKQVFLLDMDHSERKTALNEVEVLSTLNHPNIIRYLGSFQKEGSLIIVMEYADGGNLAQLINAKKNKNEIFTEKSILNISSQMSSALAYMHSNKILHRDLKTANIFLNMNGNVKVGDFGISKMLNTRSQAQTVVGTPYYLSPEMCEGSDYNDKSDIWAMGCILYELTCLRKPFEALTLPVLVQKITTCQYEDIPEIYSQDLLKLITSILQKNPNLRPSARYVHDTAIPKILSEKQDLKATNSFQLGVPRERSILYKVYDFGDDQKIIPLELPHKKILDFCISATHQIVVTFDHSVYTWGDNKFGQLALGKAPRSKVYATFSKPLQNQQIERCAAGAGFSLFLTNGGLLFSCGEGEHGCLGHGDWNNLSTPKIIESLKHVCITQVCCGDEHVVALTSEGKVFTWGSSKLGQLGQGHTQSRCTPLAIKLVNLAKIKNIFCGDNESVLLTVNGQIWVSGCNNYGKLGVTGKENIVVFTWVASLKDKIKFVSVGSDHATMLTENGIVLAFGKNYHKNGRPQFIKMTNKITMIASGIDFNIAGDCKNVLWFWGSASKSIKSVQDISVRSSNSVLPLFQASRETIVIKDFGLVENTENFIKRPISILALYASGANVKSGNIIYLGNIKVRAKSLYMLAHTTSPPPVKQFTDNELNEPDTMSFVDDSTVVPSSFTILPNTM